MIDPTSREDPKFKELVKVSYSLMWLEHPCWFQAFFWGCGGGGARFLWTQGGPEPPGF